MRVATADKHQGSLLNYWRKLGERLESLNQLVVSTDLFVRVLGES